MVRPSDLEFCTRLAKGIAQQFGSNCEVVVHDLSTNDPGRSIVAIENGHVSGRSVGDGSSHVVLEALRTGAQGLEDRFAYLTRSDSGKILKSTTLYIRDDDGQAIGIFSINYDITMMLAMEQTLKSVTHCAQPDQAPEVIPHNVSELLGELIDQSVHMVGKPVALMNKEDKVRAIRFLNETGAFLITKAGDRVCKHFAISKYTLYSYLDESKNREETP